MTVYKQNLQALYNETVPKYELLETKLEEVNARGIQVVEEMKVAKESYDIATLTTLTTEAKSLDEIAKQIRKDMEAYTKEMSSNNRKDCVHPKNIRDRIYDAYDKDWAEENKRLDVQQVLSRMAEIEAELKVLKEQYNTMYHEAIQEYDLEISKFRKVTKGLSHPPQASNMGGFYLIK